MPDTHYAKSGSVHIAYQTVGSGSIDLVLIPGLWTHLEHQWEEPAFARFLNRLASFARLIILDARGAGLSDRALELPPMEEQMDDVLDSLSSRERRVLQLRFGLEDGRQRTLEEVGKEFGVTRERIRQIEAKALRKLRHPTRSRKLRDYFDH